MWSYIMQLNAFKLITHWVEESLLFILRLLSREQPTQLLLLLVSIRVYCLFPWPHWCSHILSPLSSFSYSYSQAAYKHADGKKIDGRRVLVDVERGRTVKGWRPRRLGQLPFFFFVFQSCLPPLKTHVSSFIFLVWTFCS